MAARKSESALEKKIARVQALLETFEEKNELRDEQENNLEMLESVTYGLYEEVEKLTKKAPGAVITDLCLEQVNDVVRETRELASDDKYVQKLKEFVPAGDNPQYQDALFVMRQVRDGLGRLRKGLSKSSPSYVGKVNYCKAILVGLRYELEEGETASEDMMVYAPTWALAGLDNGAQYLDHEIFKGRILERKLGVE